MYENTSHISLISTFVTEILAGKFLACDYGDASGMNLMDIREKVYVKDMIDFIPGLEEKLS